MAAPCRILSARMYRIIRGHSRHSSHYATSIFCRRISYRVPINRILLCQRRTVSTSCRTLNAPSNPSDQSKVEKPKVGIIKRLVVKTHHATIWFLNKISPKARVFYERFVDGMTSFAQDFRHVYLLNRQISGKKVRVEDLGWHDIFKKLQMKQDLAKVLPVLVVVNIPFVYYVTLPLVLYFQRHFLSNHFLTPDDLASNYQDYHKRRRLVCSSILEVLDKRLTEEPTSDLAGSFRERISESNLQRQPLTANELLACRATFGHHAPLKALSRKHLKYLCKLHSQWISFAPNSTLRKRLSTHASMLSLMDKAALKSGLDSVEETYLRELCNQRGFNPVGSDQGTLIEWLVEWGHISTSIKDEDRSLLLHASIFLVAGRRHQGDDHPIKSEIPHSSPDSTRA